MTDLNGMRSKLKLAESGCFGQLLARYPREVMELCEREADDEFRLYCYVEYPEVDPCELCERHRFVGGSDWRLHNAVCDSPECMRLWGWYTERYQQNRRNLFKKQFGCNLRDYPKPQRREAILTAMLECEAKERANVGRPRQRVAA